MKSLHYHQSMIITVTNKCVFVELVKGSNACCNINDHYIFSLKLYLHKNLLHISIITRTNNTAVSRISIPDTIA